MEEKLSRVRWDDQELSRLAAVMAPCLLADPRLHPLDAVRQAQDCLEPHRRRELKAWSLVEARLQPKLDEAMARLKAIPAQLAVEESVSPPSDVTSLVDGAVEGTHAQPLPGLPLQPVAAALDAGSASADEVHFSYGAPEEVQEDGSQADVVPPDGTPADDLSLDLFGTQPALNDTSDDATGTRTLDERATEMAPVASDIMRSAAEKSVTGEQREPVPAAAPVTVNPLAIEAALVVALQSPAVEQALVELFSRTMSAALQRATAGDAHAVPTPAFNPVSEQRVLLAGFAEPQRKALMDALSASFEVRAWNPSSGPQVFQTLVKLCKIVVFPEDADDEAEAGLKDMEVRVIRHAGSTSRLLERIEELG